MALDVSKAVEIIKNASEEEMTAIAKALKEETVTEKNAKVLEILKRVDPDRYRDTYWSRFGPEYYFAGDGAKYDERGNIWLLGRVDDVMNVSGHRLSTAEIESALVSHPKVAEAAVVGATDEMTGQAVCAFVILRDEFKDEDGGDGASGGVDIVTELRNHVAHEIGPIAKPRQILVVAELPKTRSGKIMRRLLRDVAEHRDLGDVTTLADPAVMNLIAEGLSGPSED